MIITLILVIVFDIFTYFFLPGHYVSEFEEYRYVPRPPGVGGTESYPNEYFVKRSDRGFDIRLWTHKRVRWSQKIGQGAKVYSTG